MFTALKIQGVKAKLVIFPDENHFITKPQNARFWWNTNHAWLAEHLSTAGRK
jgi:dipeptidyl aminopeptidase/acylaminoacyl peptidase